MDTTKLTNLRLDITSYCDETCNFCPFHGDGGVIEKGDYIDLEHYVRLAEDLKNAGLSPLVRLVGTGEATLYPEFSKLLDVFHENGHRLKLITNGQHLSKNAAEIGSNIETVVVSVHGGEQTHNRIVNKKNSYSILMNGIEDVKIVNPNIDFYLHFVISPDNYHEMKEHVERAFSVGATPRFQHLVFTEANFALGSFDMSTLGQYINEIQQNFPSVRFIPELNEQQRREYYLPGPYIRTPHKCLRILTDLAVRYDGKVIMCDDRLLGDITQESIVDILKGDLRRDYLITRTALAMSEKGLPPTCSRCCYN